MCSIAQPDVWVCQNCNDVYVLAQTSSGSCSYVITDEDNVECFSGHTLDAYVHVTLGSSGTISASLSMEDGTSCFSGTTVVSHADCDICDSLPVTINNGYTECVHLGHGAHSGTCVVS